MREERLQVLEKIKQAAAAGQFDAEVETPLVYQPLDAKKLDLARRKLSSKIKTLVAYHLGERFFKSLIKQNFVSLAEPQGVENLAGFQGGAVVTCNHLHPFDSYGVLLGLMKHFKKGKGGGKHLLVKVIGEANYAQPGLVGFLMRHAETLPISNDETRPNLRLTAKSMRVAEEFLLKKQKKLLIYPEGSMWWHYRQPRPLKKGAFHLAAKFNVPVIPCFYTLRDLEQKDPDGFNTQEYTLHILPPIYPDSNLSVADNTSAMLAQNARLWQECYEKSYGKTK